jgi:hypothetical protein
MKLTSNTANKDLRIQVLKRNLQRKKKEIKKKIKSANFDTTIELMMQFDIERGRIELTTTTNEVNHKEN